MKEIVGKHFSSGSLSSDRTVSQHKYHNCIFERLQLSEYRFINCEFENCEFLNCNFSKSFLAMNKSYDSGKFTGSTFVNCNLSKTSFRFPIIDHCEFRNCILNETNFDGSRFSNTTFIGELDSCFFRGHSIYAKANTLMSFSKFDPSTVPNKMLNVDFSLARLVGLTFSNNINLDKCKFPNGENYLYIPDLQKTISEAKVYIQENWEAGYEKETGIRLIQYLYENKDVIGQPNYFIDSFVADEMSDEDSGVSMKLFYLFKSLQ